MLQFNKTLKKFYFLLPLAVIIIAWQLISGFNLVNSSLFPPPSRIFLAFIELLKNGELYLDIKSSLGRVFIGLFIGSFIGVIFGLLTGRINIINKSLSPLFNILRSFPPVAIIPIIIVWLGIGESAKLFSIAFATFFPVWINTHVGASRIPIVYTNASSILTKSSIKKWFSVILPASLPYIITGIRISIGVAFVMVFVSELAGASSGIGYLISISQLSYRMDRMFVGLFLLGFFGFITDYIFTRLTKYIFPWLEKI